MSLISQLNQRTAYSRGNQQQIPFGRQLAGSPLLQGICFLAFLNENGGSSSTSTFSKVFDLIGQKDGTLTGETTPPVWKNQRIDFSQATGTTAGANFGATPGTQDLALQSATPLGFSVVARVTPTSAWGSTGGVVRRNDGNTVNAGWELLLTNGGMNLSFVRATSNFSARTTATINSAGQSTTVAACYGGDLTAANVALYYDGVAQTHSSDTNGSGAQGSDSSRELVVGQSNYNNNSINSGPLKAYMDWIGIWRRKLTQEEVLALTYDAGQLTRPTNFYLRVSDATGGGGGSTAFSQAFIMF